MSDLHDRFRAASASADWIFHRPPSTPAAMLRELADHAEANDLAWDRYGERGRGRPARGRGRRAARQARRGDVPQRGDGAAGDPAGLVRPGRLAPCRAARPVAPRAPRAGRAAAGAGSRARVAHHRAGAPPRPTTSPRSAVGSARRWSSCRCATPAACCRRGTSWSGCPRPPASVTCACTPTGRGSGSRCPTGTAAWPRSPRCSTRSTSRSTRDSAAPAAPWWPARTTSPGSCARGGSGWAARSSR